MSRRLLPSFWLAAGIVLAVAACLVTGLSGAEETVELTVSLTLERRVYDYSDYGEPPQLAIWLENSETGEMRTVFITRRTATGDWHGKIECPVSLPYWVSRYNASTGASGLPGRKNRVPDAVTGATPKETLTVKEKIPKGSTWVCFIEMNVAGDFNRDFPSVLDDGAPDPQANGQPSLVYKGQIEAVKGKKVIPELVGRTLQMDPTDKLVTDLTGITNAKKVITKVVVSTN